jgi:hypothetical protein
MSVPKNYSTQFLINFDLKRAYRVLDWIRTTISPATYIGFSDAPISTSEGLETCDHVEQLLTKIQKYRDQYITNIEQHLVLTKGHGCQYPLVEIDEYTYEAIYNNVDPSMVRNLAAINDYHQQMLWHSGAKDVGALSVSSQEISNTIVGENRDLLQDSLNSDIFDTYRVGNDFIFKSHEGCVTTLESYYEKHFEKQLIYCPQFQMLSPTTNFDYSALLGQGSYLLHVILAKTYLRRWIPICDAGRCSILIDKETYLLTLGIEYKVVEINGLHKDILVIHALALDSLEELTKFKGVTNDIQIGCGRGRGRGQGQGLPHLVCVNIDPQKTPKIKSHQVINTGQLMIDVTGQPYTDLYDAYTGIFMSYQRQEVLKGVSSVMGLTKPNVNKVVTRMYGKKQQQFTRPQLHLIIDTLSQPAAQVAGGGGGTTVPP